VSESRQINLFYSYAHNDEALRNELDKHLSILQRRGIIAEWYDRNISAGTEWVNQIDHHLNIAHIILLLISSDFLASDYCYSIEMKRALERHDLGEARVIPILIRPVDWHGAPFAKLRVLPQNAQPVTAWLNQDLAFVEIAIQIRKVANELEELRQTQSSGSKKPLMSIEDESEDVIKETRSNLRHELVPRLDSQAIKQFRRCQKKVEELKNIHNMLHEVEVQLAGLVATIYLADQEYRKGKKGFFNAYFARGAKDSSKPAFDYIEILWQQTALKVDDLEYFAAEVMAVLEDERFRLDNGAVRGPLWATELFFLQQSFEISMKDQDRNAVRRLADELLTKCRIHLYRIDKRLLDAVKDLELASDILLRYAS
jgi:hypothetical protein